VVMSHVLSREKREQVIALGRLGWSLRRIEQATGVRRETAGDYLRGAGIALRRPGGWGRHSPSKAAIDPITDSGGGDSKAAIEVITGFLARKPGCGPASSCEPYRELIALELERGRNAMGIWQDLVDSHGFAGGYQSVRRFVRNLRGAAMPETRAIIETPAGEECQVDYGTGPMVRDPDSGIVSAMRTARVVRRHRCFNCWLVRTRREPISALFATPSMLARANSECVASRAFSNWSSNMAAWLRTMPVRRRWNCVSPSIVSCGAIWSAARRRLSLCDRSIHSSAN